MNDVYVAVVLNIIFMMIFIMLMTEFFYQKIRRLEKKIDKIHELINVGSNSHVYFGRAKVLLPDHAFKSFGLTEGSSINESTFLNVVRYCRETEGEMK